MSLEDQKRINSLTAEVADLGSRLEEAEQCLLMVASYRADINAPGPRSWSIAGMMVRFAENYFSQYPRDREKNQISNGETLGPAVRVGIVHMGARLLKVERDQ